MKLLSLKAAAIYLTLSIILYTYYFISLRGRYYETASQKPVYPILHYTDQNILNSVNSFVEGNILLFFVIFISIPLLNIFSIGISATCYIKNKNTRLFSIGILIIAIFQWLSYLFMRFYK